MAMLDPNSVKRIHPDRDNSTYALFVSGVVSLEGEKDKIAEQFYRETRMHSGQVEMRKKDENGKWTKVILRRQEQ